MFSLLNHEWNILKGNDEKEVILVRNKKVDDKNVDKTPTKLENGSAMFGFQRKKSFRWFMKPGFYTVGYIYTGSRLYINLLLSYITFFVHYTVMLHAQYVAIVPIVLYTSGLVASLVIKSAINHYQLERLFMISCIVALCRCIQWISIVFKIS